MAIWVGAVGIKVALEPRGRLMSAPVKRGEQCLLPVIRVDMEVPFIECYVDASFKGFVKGMRREVMGRVINGWGTKQQTVMERILNKINEIRRPENFTLLAGSSHLRLRLNELIKLFDEFIKMLPAENSRMRDFSYPHNQEKLYDEAAQKILLWRLGQLYDLISGRSSSKPDPVYVASLKTLYNDLANAVMQTPADGWFFPKDGSRPAQVAFYRPVLLRVQ